MCACVIADIHMGAGIHMRAGTFTCVQRPEEHNRIPESCNYRQIWLMYAEIQTQALLIIAQGF